MIEFEKRDLEGRPSVELLQWLKTAPDIESIYEAVKDVWDPHYLVKKEGDRYVFISMGLEENESIMSHIYANEAVCDASWWSSQRGGKHIFYSQAGLRLEKEGM